MAKSVGFEGANEILLAPVGDDNCSDLECFKDGHNTISCWRLSERELEEIAKTGVVWFAAVGNTHPPIYISGEALVNVGDKPSRAEPILTREEP